MKDRLELETIVLFEVLHVAEGIAVAVGYNIIVLLYAGS
jgi:hypothetical protein